MEKHILVQIVASFGVAVILGLLVKAYIAVVATPRRLRRLLKQQGIGGPPPANFLLGNVMEMKKQTPTPKTAKADPHNFGNELHAVFHKWRRQYGDMYTFSLGTKPVLVVNDYDVIRELSASKSLDLGRPLYLSKDFESLLGNGVSASNGKLWAYERKIIAPGLNMNKIQGMRNSIQKSALMLIDSWKSVIDGEGGKADIKVDNFLIKFAGDAISRVCFGSNYAEGELLFQKLQALVQVTASKGFLIGIPGIRHVPTKQNRREWELRREAKELISKLLKVKEEADEEENMLKFILQGAKSGDLSPNEIEDFIIDNCKSILLAGYEPVSIAASWILMLLASNQEWQDRARQEVIQVCKGQVPEFESIRHMKELTMVIYESLRLYTSAHIASRYSINDLEFGKIRIPKGVIIWVMTTALHTDPEIWGPDSYEFKPERFANGTSGACKLPHLFTPFGFGSRVCLGQNLAMVELKLLFAHILSNFSFSLSPNYVHDPTINLHLKPGNGVDLVIQRLK